MGLQIFEYYMNFGLTCSHCVRYAVVSVRMSVRTRTVHEGAKEFCGIMARSAGGWEGGGGLSSKRNESESQQYTSEFIARVQF